VGQSRHFVGVLATSGLPPTTDMSLHCANCRDVPILEVAAAR
jgi:hypothetical protein